MPCPLKVGLGKFVEDYTPGLSTVLSRILVSDCRFSNTTVDFLGRFFCTIFKEIWAASQPLVLQFGTSSLAHEMCLGVRKTMRVIE
jgi:hypothetical protein